MADRKQQFVAKVDELVKQSRSLTPAARKTVIDLLESARKQIVAEISAVDPSSFSSAQLQTLRHSIDNVLTQFKNKASAQIGQLQEQAYKAGTASMADPVAAVSDQAIGLGRVDASVLSIAQGYTADLITGLSAQAAAKVNGAIQRAFLGGQSLSDIITQIGRATGGDQFTGIFSTIGERAMTIATNEVLRVQSIAAQAKLEEMAPRHPDLQKEWLHIPAARIPRIAHLLADGQVKNVDEPFVVDGEELMYPRDPNGSPENTISCHCLMRPYFSDDALKSSGPFSAILDDLGITVSAA